MLVPIVFFCLTSYVNAKLCDNNQYWSSILERCENCSRCVHPEIVIRPCQAYADTVCGPLSELNIDWTWLNTQTHSGGKVGSGQKEMMDTFKENLEQIRKHELHMKEKEMYQKRKHQKDLEDDDSEDEIEGGDILVGDRYKFKKDEGEQSLWNKLKLMKKHRTLGDKVSDEMTLKNERNENHLEMPMKTLKTWQKLLRARADAQLHFDDEEAFELLKSSRNEENKKNETYDPNHLKFDENGILIKNFGFTKVEDNVKMEKLIDEAKFPEDFSTTEKFILDWQTVILGIAVCSCIIFFLVAAFYSMQHAKHWKKLKNHFDADVEELQSWISSKKSVNKVPSSGIYKTTTEVVHTEGSQCKYLERIIRMNGKNKFNFVAGNVYEKDNKRPTELKPLTKKYESKVGDNI